MEVSSAGATVLDIPRPAPGLVGQGINGTSKQHRDRRAFSISQMAGCPLWETKPLRLAVQSQNMMLSCWQAHAVRY